MDLVTTLHLPPRALWALLSGRVAWATPGTPCIYTLVDSGWEPERLAPTAFTWGAARPFERIAPAQRIPVQSKEVAYDGAQVALYGLPPQIELWEGTWAKYVLCLEGRPSYTRADYAVLFYYDLNPGGGDVKLEGDWIRQTSLNTCLIAFNPQGD